MTKKTLFIICLLAATSLKAEIIDRMVAVVNNHIITLSDLRREREIRTVLGIAEPKDDKTILRELIDAQIIEDQIAQFPGIDVTETQLDSELKKHADLRGVSPEVLREAILRRLRASEFVQVRFRQFIRPTDEEVRNYYRTVFVPRAERQGMTPIPSFEQIEEAVRMNVTEEKVAHEIENWLDAIRRRSDIEVFD